MPFFLSKLLSRLFRGSGRDKIRIQTIDFPQEISTGRNEFVEIIEKIEIEGQVYLERQIAERKIENGVVKLVTTKEIKKQETGELLQLLPFSRFELVIPSLQGGAFSFDNLKIECGLKLPGYRGLNFCFADTAAFQTSTGIYGGRMHCEISINLKDNASSTDNGNDEGTDDKAGG